MNVYNCENKLRLFNKVDSFSELSERIVAELSPYELQSLLPYESRQNGRYYF